MIAPLVFVYGFTIPACREAQGPPNSNTGSADTRRAAFTTPPFSTKEPTRYQAIRITSFTETGAGNSSVSQSNQVLIARDGERRREEYFAEASGQIVYLEIPSGRFILLPASKLYADLSTASDENDPNRPDDSPNLSPDQLLNESLAPATYEQLGTETLAGRVTTKYRVLSFPGANTRNETLIWIDEALGLPVRSEANSTSGGHSTKVTMELKDIKLEVDDRSFSWPSDYRRVESRAILDQIRKAGKSATPKQDEK